MRRCFCLLAIVALVGACSGEQSSDDSPSSSAAVSSSSSVPADPGVTTTGGVPSVSSGASSVQTADGSGAGSSDAGADTGGSGSGGSAGSPFAIASAIFSSAFGSSSSDEDFDEQVDLDRDGSIGADDVFASRSAQAGVSSGGEGSGGMPGSGFEAARPFSNSSDCKFCHPRQFNEWRTSPHAYTGISPTFYSLVAAGQNSFGAGLLIDASNGVAQAGVVGNFCLPCHAPIGFIGLEGRYGNNNGGFGDVQPVQAFVCSPFAPQNALQPCTQQASADICGAPGQCAQWQGRTCVNMPPVRSNTPFPRRQVHCSDDSDCAAGRNGCPGGGEDCGPCIIAPATIYYPPEAQDGINCESCHNALPNHQRACQIYRNSDSTGTFSFNIEEMETPDGRRLRLGPYPLSDVSQGQGIPTDVIPPVLNAFHESARVETPLVVPYEDTDRPFGVANPANTNVQILRPTALTCDELPYCGGQGFALPGEMLGRCQGGLAKGAPCANDGQCGGCAGGVCQAPSPRAGLACNNSIDCGEPADQTQNVLLAGVADGTLDPLILRNVNAGEIDRPDGNYYRSSMFCASCHDVRPPFVNEILRSCQLAGTQVCETDVDCQSLNIGCPSNDCGPCVAENADDPTLAGAIGGGTGAEIGDERNLGFRRVENLFSEWQISVYNHPELTFCQGNSFRACTSDADCQVTGFDEGPCNVASPYGGQVITCQDCHMSNFPETPLIDFSAGAPGVVTPKNALYSQKVAALDGSQSNTGTPLPVRRVSTHFMAGVDLPLVRFPGQGEQARRRQELVDSGFKITVESLPSAAVAAGDVLEVEITVENVGVGHRFPAGFSHERQNWLQVFVQEEEKLVELGIEDDPFADNAPCHMQRTIATGAEDSRDPVGAAALEIAGCIYRSGFILDKAHPETGEMVPDGSLDDEDPEDFFVVAGTRMRGNPGDPRIEVTPGAPGRALTISNICAEATEETYRASIAAGSGIDMGTNPDFPFQVRFCDAALSPAQGPGHTSPGFGNPMCMEGDADLGPCVPEIELSDGNERGRCAGDLARGSCQRDSDCGPAGPCLFRCAGFPELECCDVEAPGTDCEDFYSSIGSDECELDSLYCEGGANAGNPCTLNGDCTGGQCEETEICVGGPRSGLACSDDSECPVSNNCGDVGECNVENKGIVNFQNQFRQSENGACVDPEDPFELNGDLKVLPGTTGCFLNANCLLQGAPRPSGRRPICVVGGQCDDANHAFCTNITYQDDCAPDVSCNIEFNLELNGRPSESVFIQNHPFNFNSMAPFQPRTFFYAVEVPPELAGKELLISARLFNRNFPMRFLRNLIGTQVVRPPLIIENRGDASNPNQCNDPRTIDIDCFVAPVVTLGNAEPGGWVPPVQSVRTHGVDVISAVP
jgi:hypothetical protein